MIEAIEAMIERNGLAKFLGAVAHACAMKTFKLRAEHDGNDTAEARALEIAAVRTEDLQFFAASHNL